MRLFLLTIAVWAACIAAQEIVLPISALDPRAACFPYTGTICPALVGVLVYSNSTMPLEATEQIGASLIGSLGAASLQFPVCSRIAQHYLCASLFPLCEEYPPTRLNNVSVVPPPPVRILLC